MFYYICIGTSLNKTTFLSMRLTRTELKQIAGELWLNGESYFLDHSEILKKFQQAIKIVGKNLKDSIVIDLDKNETEQVTQIKRKLNLT
jgi:hypothetical protein